MAGLYIEPDMEGIHGFNRRNQEEDFLQQFRAWSPAGGRREVTSRLTSPWDPPVIEPKEKKGTGRAGSSRAVVGLSLTALCEAGKKGWPNWAWAGSG